MKCNAVGKSKNICLAVLTHSIRTALTGRPLQSIRGQLKDTKSTPYLALREKFTEPKRNIMSGIFSAWTEAA